MERRPHVEPTRCIETDRLPVDRTVRGAVLVELGDLGRDVPCERDPRPRGEVPGELGERDRERPGTTTTPAPADSSTIRPARTVPRSAGAAPARRSASPPT